MCEVASSAAAFVLVRFGAASSGNPKNGEFHEAPLLATAGEHLNVFEGRE